MYLFEIPNLWHAVYCTIYGETTPCLFLSALCVCLVCAGAVATLIHDGFMNPVDGEFGISRYLVIFEAGLLSSWEYTAADCTLCSTGCSQV